MTKTQNSSLPLEEVLYAFSMEDRKVDAELLDEYSRHYPDHAQALTEFAVVLALDAFCTDEIPTTSENQCENISVTPAVARAMSRFQYKLNAVRMKAAARIVSSAPPKAAENPISSLSREAVRALAASLNVNMAFVIKLRDRLIDGTTMTQGFIDRVATELKCSADSLKSHFCAPPLVIAQQYYKSTQKPEVIDRQTFQDAVRNSGLTDEQQQQLLKL
jgi:hypothetical protein